MEISVEKGEEEFFAKILEAIPANLMGPTPNSLYLLSKDWTLLVVGRRESRFKDPSS